MGDISDILGVNAKSNSYLSEEASKFFTDRPKSTKLLRKPKGMSREVFGLIGHESIHPSMQTNKVVTLNPSFKTKRASIFKGKWIWAPLMMTPNLDNQAKHHIYHWVKAEIQIVENPYAKFDINLPRISYTDEEYDLLLQSDAWTRSETDFLMELCHRYDLRWPVISDRYTLVPNRGVEDLQERYYSIILKLRNDRLSQQQEFQTSTNIKSSEVSSSYAIFDIEQEKTRRSQLELQFRKTKEEEQEESVLREELKAIDLNLKKIKKMTKPGVGFGPAPQLSAGSTGSTGLPTDHHGLMVFLSSDNNTMIESCSSLSGIASDHFPVDTFPLPNKPYLQSSRLDMFDNSSIGVSKALLKKALGLLADLGLPAEPLPTRNVCDLYEQVHKAAVLLISLQNILAKKEKNSNNNNKLKKEITSSSLSEPLLLPHSALLSPLPAVNKEKQINVNVSQSANQNNQKKQPAQKRKITSETTTDATAQPPVNPNTMKVATKKTRK